MRTRAKTAASEALVMLICLTVSAEVTMTITSPAEGKPFSSPHFSARLQGITEPVTVRVDCAGATHFLMVRPVPPGPAPRPGQRVREPGAYDSSLPIVPGKQELTASVLSMDGKELVAKQKVSFTVESLSDEAIAKGNFGLNKVYDTLNGSAAGLSEAWRNFCNCLDAATRGSKPEGWDSVRRQAALYLAARSDDFHARLKAYADLANIYLGAGRPADALRAAQEADRIYEAEKGNTTAGEFFNNFPVIYDPRPAQTVGSPAHFAAMATLCAMKGDLAGALAWYEKAISFQTAQAQAGHLDANARKRCLDEAAGLCRQQAWLTFQLTNDLAKYRQFMDRAEKLAGGSAGGTPPAVLLGQ